MHALGGDAARRYAEWRADIVAAQARVEAVIDFGDDEDDVTEDALSAAVESCGALEQEIRWHLDRGRRGAELVRLVVRSD